MNERWQEVALKDVTESITVGHVGPMADEYVEDGIPFLRSLNIQPYRIDLNDVKFITPRFHNQLSKSSLQPGDVVVVRTGKPGTAAVIPEALSVANCADLVIIRPGSHVDARFLAYYFNSSVGQRHVDSRLVGSVQKHFNIGDARKTKLRLPPLAVQERIADILGSLDDKVEVNREMNWTLEAMAQALYRHWFVDFDPFQDGAFEDSELGQIPVGWEAKSLDSIADFLNGVAWTRYKARDGEPNLPVLKIRELQQGINDQSDRVGSSLPSQYVIRSGDVIFSWSGTLILKRWDGETSALNQHLFKVTPLGYPSWFCYYAIDFHIGEFRRIAANKATTMGHINRHHLSEAFVAVPPPGLMENFDRQVAPLFSQIQANASETAVLKETRGYLLPKLLSGEVGVGEAKEIAEVA